MTEEETDGLKILTDNLNKLTGELNKNPPIFVPYEIFRQAMDIQTENLKQLYSMLHELNMEKNFTVEIDMGGIKFVVCGDSQNSQNVVKAADLMVDKFTKKFFTKAELTKLTKEMQKRETDAKKGYG
jgi:hypothetical protein